MTKGINKWLKWEFWPVWFFYTPLYFRCIGFALKARSTTFYTGANPLMKHGGLLEYSKYNVLKEIDKQYLPVTSFFEKANVLVVLQRMQELNLSFPIILKPDIGERGFGVEKIDSEKELDKYFIKYGNIEALILQEYINYPIELGVMYSRKPSEEKGEISSIVMKEFLTITGDGKSTLKELLHSDKRILMYLEGLLEEYSKDLDLILPDTKRKELVAIGNHCRGTTFLNANYLINKNIHKIFDAISIPIEGFYFGRYDLRVSSIEDFNEGKNIKIMELNGAASEPAHIYDPNMPLFKAYKHLFAHWNRLCEISIENNKNGNKFTSLKTVLSMLIQRRKS